PKIEEWAQKHPVAGPILRFLDATGGAAMATPEAIVKRIKDAINPYPVKESSVALAEGVARWADPNVRKGAVSLLPEALGQGVGNVAGGEILGSVGGKVVSKTAKTVQNAFWSPEWQEALEHPTKIPVTVLRKVIPEPETGPSGLTASERAAY